jgi:hypothetical protein
MGKDFNELGNEMSFLKGRLFISYKIQFDKYKKKETKWFLDIQVLLDT